MKYNITTFLYLSGLFLTLTSCSVTKHVEENELLLVKNSIDINDGQKKDHWQLDRYIVQKPNTKFVFPFKLYYYNLANLNYMDKWHERIERFSDSTNTFSNVFSFKQGVGYANFQKKLSEWSIKNGEAPVIIDTSKIEKSSNNLRLHMIDNGYFNTIVDYDIEKKDIKKGKVNYHVFTGEPYFLDSIYTKIDSPVLDSLYHMNLKKTYVKKGQQFKRTDFENEAERLTSLFRNAGVFHFTKYSINFRDIDSTQANHKTDVLVDISNQLFEEGDSILEKPYEISHIGRVNIFTGTPYKNDNNVYKDSLVYNNIYFYDPNKVPYKPKHFTKNIFIKPGDIYSDKSLELTRMHLRRINNFKSVRFNYEETEDNLLTANIFLTPEKKHGIKFETEAAHSNIKPFSFSGIASYNNINTFKGNELMKLSLQGGLAKTAAYGGLAWEIGVDASLKFPRLVQPFKISDKIIQNISPETLLSLGTSFQKNIGLDKQRFTGIFSYNWNADNINSHNLEVINAQLIKNRNIDLFFDRYISERKKLDNINETYFPNYITADYLDFISMALDDTTFKSDFPDAYKTVQNVQSRYNIITEDVFVPAVVYTYTHNTQNGFKDLSYSYFRSRISSSGLISSALTNQTTDSGDKQLFGVNIAQYAKLDLEFIKHWEINASNVLAFRSSLGVGIPYGNSSVLPFSRSYFAGGPNDIRAWKIYELGPGAEQSGLEFNVGNLKFLTNLEYRFNIYQAFKGALFVDAGNIWDISKSSLTTDAAKFDSLSSLENIAVGTGFGLRYDFSFLVLRGDFGFKTYEPYLESGKRWFNKSELKKPVLNIGINYPF